MAPYSILLSLYFLWAEVGMAAFSGIAVLLVLIPANIWFSKIGERLQRTQLEKKDTRIKLMSEIITGMKVIKLYGW